LRAEIVAGVRLEMLGRGFSLVDTPRVMHDALLLAWQSKQVVPTLNLTHWWKYPLLEQYARWLAELLGKVLPSEPVSLAGLDLRHEPAGFVDNEVDRLHADGSYIRSVFTLFGLSTVYRDGKAELPVPHGHTLLMTAQDRARAVRVPCTLHRRPACAPERAVIVCSFEPRQEKPRWCISRRPSLDVARPSASRRLRGRPRWPRR
jgi:hypothetical protein